MKFKSVLTPHSKVSARVGSIKSKCNYVWLITKIKKIVHPNYIVYTLGLNGVGN